ncbi:GntR family transcriptional regulator YhfZ [Pectinatus frisingensis]|uniref:GntR family transcriptional regulator YhfZ n=1 Tax=Pectinatus frisingensis TaxID=865 RepID=UPI003D8020F8
MDVKIDLMQKNGFVTIKLARELMTMQCGDRMATIEEYSKSYKTGRGTVQNALKRLEQYKAIELEARGHLGTYIVSINYKMLWQFTGLGMIMGVMPLPYTKLYEGLATGLFNVLNEKDIPFSLAYMRGARSRLAALDSKRYDFAVVSALAADVAIEEEMQIDKCISFGKFTYVNKHGLIFGAHEKTAIEDGMKVGVDRSSIDQYLLTLQECKNKNVELVDLAYNQIFAKLKSGEIDVAVWNKDELTEKKLSAECCPLQWNDGVRDTEAVIVINRSNFGLKNLFASFISRDKVLNYQHDVVAGKIIPNF